MEHPDRSLVPSTAEQLSWITTICERGIRRPGSVADHWVTEWIADELRATGLDDVHLEPVPLPRWEPKTWSLHAWPADAPDTSVELPCFPLPHSAPVPKGVEAPIARVEDDPRGALALTTVTLMRLPQAVMRERAIRYHDPDGEFDHMIQTLPFGPAIQNVMSPAIDAGAAGFIGVFDAPWDSSNYYVPYDAVERPIPGVWISRSSGAQLDAMLSGGTVCGRLTVDSAREDTITHNVLGSLDGPTDEWIVIGSHHDGPWVSAVEDASGVALVLAQARYWSRIPPAARPHNLLFLVTSGHMAHGAGTTAFIADHRALLPRVVLEVHLEHTARECHGEEGRLVPRDDPEVRWWFTSRGPRLVDSVEHALRAEDLRRSLVLPPDVFGPHPTTDGGFFHLEGVPLVNFLTAPMYLFDAQDTPDKIHEASLEPVTRAAVRIIASTRGTSAQGMRGGITPQDAL